MVYNRKVYVVGGCKELANWVEWEEIVSSMELADMVMFAGGPDVNPAIYGDKLHPMTRCSVALDRYECAAFNRALTLKKKMVGICRGAQFLCVMSGGRLVQHQANIDSVHQVTSDDNKEYWVTSDHHQAQYPWGLAQKDFRVLAWTQGLSPFHHDGDEREMVYEEVKGAKEVEICHYLNTKCLGIQCHPEWMFPKRLADLEMMESIQWLRRILDRFMWGTL